MSEVLTSFQVRFPVGVCAFQFRLSAEVTFTHGEMKSRLGDQSKSEICKPRTDRTSVLTVHCAEGLFHRSFIGTVARVFHVTPPQRIMKRDADVHE